MLKFKQITKTDFVALDSQSNISSISIQEHKYYLVDEEKAKHNLEILEHLRDNPQVDGVSLATRSKDVEVFNYEYFSKKIDGELVYQTYSNGCFILYGGTCIEKVPDFTDGTITEYQLSYSSDKCNRYSDTFETPELAIEHLKKNFEIVDLVS